MKVPGIPYVQGRNAYKDVDGMKYGIAIHCTANTASAEGEASYATRRNDGVSSHFYADNNSVVQSLDTASRAGHAGSNTGNENAVAVEITGMNSYPRQWWLDNVAWDLLGRVLATVCWHHVIAVRRASVAEMRSNPKVRAFYSHNDMRLAWGHTTHTDPGPNFPWDRLLAAVNTGLGGAIEATEDVREEDMFFAKVKGDNKVWKSDGKAHWDGGLTSSALATMRAAGLILVEFTNMADLIAGCGPLAEAATPPTIVEISPEQLAEVSAAAAAGAASAAAGATPEEVRAIVDEELDEQARAGADVDT